MTESPMNHADPVGLRRQALFSRPLPILIFIVVAVLLDQAIKFAVELYLPLEQDVPILPVLALHRIYNLGVAFSMLSDMNGWFIVIMRLLIVAFVLWLWNRTAKDRWLAHLGFALIIAGALGNLVDRFVYGHVIDYIRFHTETWSFAVFNLADSFITVGAAAVILDELLLPKRPNV